MKPTVSLGLGLVVASCVFVFAGCGDDDDDNNPGRGGGGAASGGGAGQGGDAHGHGETSSFELECKVLGRLCHEADTGSDSGTAHECHEIGHEGHADECGEAFDGCIAFCVPDEGAGGSGGAGTTQDSHCAALGELCHAVDDGDGPLHACHELGHVNNAARCAAEFDDCATQCLAARELLGNGTAGAGGGGAGGMSSGGVSGAGGGAGGAQ
jgi:hypothetical protein